MASDVADPERREFALDFAASVRRNQNTYIENCTCLTAAIARLPIARWHAVKNTRASITKLKITAA